MEDGKPQFESLGFARVGTFARVDTDRELRQGAPEAILAEGKTPAQVASIFQAMDAAGAGSVLATRADAEVRAAVREVVPDAVEHEQSRSIWVARSLPSTRGVVAIVSAGTSDGAVLHEARIRPSCSVRRSRSLRTWVSPDFTGSSMRFQIWSAPTAWSSSPAWNGALASVIGGLVACPVIGVPTSVGYALRTTGARRSTRC